MSAATSRTRSNGLRLNGSGGVGGYRRHASPAAATSVFAISPSSSADFFNRRSASPTRVNLVGSASGRSVDPISAKRGPISSFDPPPRKTCMCSPTTHPGSFRCSLHKGSSSPRRAAGRQAVSSPSNRLNARRSAMTNSLVRIGTVEGEWVKRSLTALIRPSSHQQRRRASFHPQPSRLSVMVKAEDLGSEAEDSPI